MSLRILSMATPASSNLSFSSRLVPDPTCLFLTSNFSHLSIAKPPKSTTIRMGGGPRTFPGGVSKWQWKRMQAKKAKQLLRARLARERQIYEMRKRAELSAAVSELERPWEVVEKAPKLFSVSADEQLKVLADRFQKPGGFDLWSEKDGPQLFESVDGVPSARFFPKGVVHSVKPYGRITDGYSDSESGLVERDEHGENLREIKKNGDKRRMDIADKGTGYQFSDEDSGLDQRYGYNEDSRIENGKFVQNGNSRRISTPDKGHAYQVFDENSERDSGFVQRTGHDKNTRAANGKFVESGNRRRISMSDKGHAYQVFDKKSDPELGFVQRNGHDENTRTTNGKFKKNGNQRRIGTSDKGYVHQVFDEMSDPQLGFIQRNGHDKNTRTANGKFKQSNGLNQRRNGREEQSGLNSKVFDMSLQDDGSYGLSKKEMEMKKVRRRIERT